MSEVNGKASADSSVGANAPFHFNQCDGCQAGIPAVNGTHRMGRPGGYPDTMSCQAGKYMTVERADMERKQ